MHCSGLIWSEGKANGISKIRWEPKVSEYYSLESIEWAKKTFQERWIYDNYKKILLLINTSQLLDIDPNFSNVKIPERGGRFVSNVISTINPLTI